MAPSPVHCQPGQSLNKSCSKKTMALTLNVFSVFFGKPREKSSPSFFNYGRFHPERVQSIDCPLFTLVPPPFSPSICPSLLAGGNLRWRRIEQKLDFQEAKSQPTTPRCFYSVPRDGKWKARSVLFKPNTFSLEISFDFLTCHQAITAGRALVFGGCSVGPARRHPSVPPSFPAVIGGRRGLVDGNEC